MTDARTLRNFPPLVPPSRPKKSPSPRLTPRRSSRRSPGNGNGCTGSSGRRFSLSQRHGQENNAKEETGNGILSCAHKRSFASRRSRTSNNGASSTILTSPMKTSGLLARENCAQMPAGNSDLENNNNNNNNNIPHSPTATATSNANASATKAKSDLSVFDFVDDYSAPLTPRNLAMGGPSSAEDVLIALTPPVRSPTPLVVSAKRVGSKVKRSYSTKRRRPTDEDSPRSEDESEMKLPDGLTPNQRAQEYWKRCYGSKKPQELLVNPQMSWSAKRAAPVKSCLSHSKPKRKIHAQIMLPPTSALLEVQSPPPNKPHSPLFSTPKSSPDELLLQPQPKCPHSKSVQFGVAQAAEYDLDAPSGRFTPLPFEIAQERFPLTAQKQEEKEGQEIAQTKENSAMLAEWEEDFDVLADDDKEDGDEEKSPKHHRKRHHSKRQRSSKRHRKGNRSERRKSSAFCSPHSEKALYDPATDSDSMPSLSVASPSPQHSHTGTFTEPFDEISDDASSRSSSLSPVPTRILSTCKENSDNKAERDVAIISQDEDMVTPRRIGFQSGLPTDTINVWTETAKNTSILSPEGKKLDVHTVFCNLALAPQQLWGGSSQQCKDEQKDLMELSAGWHSSMNRPLHNALDLLSRELEGQPEVSLANLGEIPSELEEKLEQIALAEWRKVECDFLQHLVAETQKEKINVTERSIVLDSIVVPERASVEPTRKHILETEEAIDKLESITSREAENKLQLQTRHYMAQMQYTLLQAPFTALSYHALCYLSPVDIAMSHERNQAIFHHLLQGLSTHVELDGSATPTVCQPTTADEISQFCSGMLCSSDGQLQEGFFDLLAGFTGDLADTLLQLATILGRVDLAALSLQRLSSVYEVSLLALEEEGHPVLVVRVQLPQKTVLNAFYRRSNARSLQWSLPSNVAVERDGKPVLGLLPTMSQLVSSSRSVVATSAFLQVACEMVLTSST